jgi:hypothetical protein
MYFYELFFIAGASWASSADAFAPFVAPKAFETSQSGPVTIQDHEDLRNVANDSKSLTQKTVEEEFLDELKTRIQSNIDSKTSTATDMHWSMRLCWTILGLVVFISTAVFLGFVVSLFNWFLLKEKKKLKEEQFIRAKFQKAKVEIWSDDEETDGELSFPRYPWEKWTSF